MGDGTLVSVADYRRACPSGSGLAPPQDNLHEDSLDVGPRFGGEGIADRIPPTHGASFGTRMPAPDPEGDDRGVVRLIELQVPLGTHTG